MARFNFRACGSERDAMRLCADARWTNFRACGSERDAMRLYATRDGSIFAHASRAKIIIKPPRYKLYI
jgi:hypothetical protein